MEKGKEMTGLRIESPVTNISNSSSSRRKRSSPPGSESTPSCRLLCILLITQRLSTPAVAVEITKGAFEIADATGLADYPRHCQKHKTSLRNKFEENNY